MIRILFCLMLALPGSAFAAQAQPDTDPELPATVSHAVVEPTAPSAGKALNAALTRLAHDPRSVDALVDAGAAATALGDNEAAQGFYTRADQIAPGRPAIKAAIAGARLRLGDPVDALRWFDQAQAGATDPAAFALDRGLAYDLVGDNGAAQAQYRTVLAHSGDAATRDEAIRRQAISLAIAGDRRAAELALLPLLQREDRAAWRAHTMVLAITGRGDEAVSVAHATMPADLATNISPYLRFMARLTPAQQAAAASLGRFPRAADIGRDDPRVAAYGVLHPRAPVVRPAAVPAAPSAAALANNALKPARRPRRGAPVQQVASAAATPAPEPELVLPAPPPPVTLAQAAPPRSTGAPVAPVAPMASRTTTSGTIAGTPARTTFDLAQAPHSAPATLPTRLATAAPSPVLHPPTVLSRLDLPPPPRRTVPLPTTPLAATPVAVPLVPSVAIRPATVAPSPVVAPTPVVAPPVVAPPVQPAKAVVEPVAPAISPPVVQPVLPAATAPVTVALATVERADPAIIAADKAANDKAAADQAAKDQAARDQIARDKAAREQAIKDKAARDKAAKDQAIKDKAAKDKAAREQAARDKADKIKADKEQAAKDKANEAEAAPAPCKPAPEEPARKGRKTRAAQAKEAGKARPATRRGAHAKAKAADTEKCAKVAKGDRPDGPGGVSRDADTDEPRATKAKGKTADKDQAKDQAKGRAKDKDTKQARYASRIWVQVLTGADADKMPNEWRNFVRKAHALKGRKPFLTPWRSNYRLLTGPFASDAEAQAFIVDLRKDGVSGFEWTSPAGQAIDSLALP